ncbi:MAG TPA: FCD domain-containing protein [Solirubrobacteraceae bacterium]|nr:FCD domain-containing protein [Solirubrobacteraceae bacterium]
MAVGTESFLSARVSRAELVARELEREIVDEREPGERLGTKEDLRKRFGVAVATVNEAVRLLEMRGMIEARPGPGGGVFVARPAARVALSHSVLGFKSGSTTYEECLEVRDALEPLIDSHAARYHRAGDIRDLNRIVKQMEVAENDPGAFFKCNWALHRRIAELCRNAPLRSMYLTLIDFLEYSIDRAEFARFDGPAMVTVHRELIKAIDAGDGPQLDAAVAAHQPTADPARLSISRIGRRRVQAV